MNELAVEFDLVEGLSTLSKARERGVRKSGVVRSEPAAERSAPVEIGVLGSGLCMNAGEGSVRVLVEAGEVGAVELAVSEVGDIGS